MFFFNLVGAIMSNNHTEIMCPDRCIPVIISVSGACRFGVVRVIFGIPKRVTSLCFRTLSEIGSFFLGAHVSHN